MPDEHLEAHYHFTLSAMVDLIDQYGYCNVINDLDALIEEKISLKLAEVTAVRNNLDTKYMTNLV